jgi:hypothetical protein
MKNKDIWDESHMSIAMPDGSTCRAYFPFQVYSTDDGSGEIVRFSWAGITKLNEAIEAHMKRETLTDLPHSPTRTALRSIE